MVDFLKGLTFIILPLGLGCKRLHFFEDKIKKFGGRSILSASEANRPDYIIVEESVGESEEKCVAALASHSLCPGDCPIIGTKWLSLCLSEGRLPDPEAFRFPWSKTSERSDSLAHVTRREECGEKRKSGDDGSFAHKKHSIFPERCLCMSSSADVESTMSNERKLITNELQKLADAFAARKDTWRANSYKNAASIIARHGKDIKTLNEAREIPGIGEKMALKIMEIIETGKLAKAEEVVDEKTQVLEMFCSVWGAGPSTAEAWYSAGHRTLRDLREKANLSKQQEIGLRLHKDLGLRMEREEVERIALIVAEEAKVASGGRCRAELVGSYRRGKKTCGDVDVLLVNPGPMPARELLLRVTGRLKQKGYITDDLVDLASENADGHRKYMGVFKLMQEGSIHRRLDLFVVPESEYAPALMHYTGSAAFNRSLRLLASRKGLLLNEHGLYRGSLRKGSEIVEKGECLEMGTERDVFQILGLEYKAPEERDH